MLAFLAVVALCFFIGWCSSPRGSGFEVAREFHWSVALMAGAVIVHVWLQCLSWMGLSWSLGSIAVLAVIACAVRIARRRGGPGSRYARCDYGWGDALALIAVVVFALCAWKLWMVTSDFFYHWGAKGQRFFLARGIDFEYLSHPWNQLINPWYPTLLPDLYALTALVRGRFNEPEMMAWSVVWIGIAVVAARQLLRVGGAGRFMAQAGVASLAMLIVAVSLVMRLAGGADWMIAAALLVGACGLWGEARKEADWVVCVAAAFAAASKVEGIVLAGIVLGTYFLQRGFIGRRRLGRALAVALPTVIVASLWYQQNARFHLFPHGSVQGIHWQRVAAVLAAIGTNVKPPILVGFPLLLLLIPCLFLARASRGLGAVVLLQLMFYLAVYVSSPADPGLFVRTSFTRLAFHLIPVVFTGALLLTRPASSPEGG